MYHIWPHEPVGSKDPYLGSIRHNQDNEETSLPNTKIMEGLVDQAGYDRVKAYARWMNANPAKAFGVEGSYAIEPPTRALFETAKLKEKHDKVFNRDGKDQSEWSMFDYRSGKLK